ncbi:MAG: hypothetical protein ABIN01_14285 [Ferruginibacter sp.]
MKKTFALPPVTGKITMQPALCIGSEHFPFFVIYMTDRLIRIRPTGCQPYRFIPTFQLSNINNTLASIN